MERAMLGVLGALVGALVGGIVGAVGGSFWISLHYGNDIYGYSGIPIVTIFIPAGIILGALIGVLCVVYLVPGDDAS
jgi:hypothetical protein